MSEYKSKVRRLRAVYTSMKQRCYNKKARTYPNYGGRGIKICDEWLESFATFAVWSVLNGYEQGLSIDRIDNDGDYSPENCRWVTQKIQGNNQRTNRLITYNGKTQTMAEWADEIDINYACLESRINRLGWSIEKALTTEYLG